MANSERPEINLPSDREATPLADDTRRKIAAGVASLRAGRGVDGEAFMAALDRELAEPVEAAVLAGYQSR